MKWMKIIASSALIVTILGFAIYMSGGVSGFIANIVSSRAGNSEEVIKLDEPRAGLQGANVRAVASRSAPKTSRKKSVVLPAKTTELPLATASSSPLLSEPHILISEVMVGTKENSKYDFVELYNNSPDATLLTGFSLRKKSATGKESSLVAGSRLSGKTIPAHGYFLIVNEGGYAGSVSADAVWPASYSLAMAKNGIVIYYNGKVVDSADWNSIPLGQSFIRDGWDNASFHISTTPTPQNTNYHQ